VERGFAAEPDARRTFLSELVMQSPDGRLKLLTTQRLLGSRREWPDVFLRGSYRGLQAAGPAAESVVGFAREAGSRRAVVLAPRLLAGHLTLEPYPGASLWEGTVVGLPTGWPTQWTCALTGEFLESTTEGGLRLSDAFRILPAACLLSGPTY